VNSEFLILHFEKKKPRSNKLASSLWRSLASCAAILHLILDKIYYPTIGVKFQVVYTQDQARGKLYRINVSGKEIDLMMTWHALERMKVWNLDISRVLLALLDPEEVIVGHHGRYIDSPQAVWETRIARYL